MEHEKVHIITDNVGGEATIVAMDEDGRLEIGRKTYNFARRVMRDPILREMVKKRAAEIRESKNE